MSDAAGFYPSPEWDVAIDEALEKGAVLEHAYEAKLAPWTNPGNRIPSRVDQTSFGARRVSVDYGDLHSIDVTGTHYRLNQRWILWSGGADDFSDRIWRLLGEVIREEFTPLGMDLDWKEQIVDAPGWVESRALSWPWAHYRPRRS